MLSLRSDALVIRVDPGHGAEVVDVVDVPTGLGLLARAPFDPAAPAGGELDEDHWTASYRGGWQLITPNAGAACRVDGVEHGFHGRASNDPWDVVDRQPSRVALRWSGHGLRIDRVLEVRDRTVTAATTWTALEARVPFVAAEHLALGPAIIDPEVRIDLPGGRAWEADAAGGPVLPPVDAPVWPRYVRTVAAPGRADRWRHDEPGSRFVMVADLPAGRLRAANRSTGLAVTVAWDVRTMPHLWLWRDVGGSGGIWRHAAQMLALEPASVAHALGLADAVAHGQAHWVQPGRPRTATTVVTVESGRA